MSCRPGRDFPSLSNKIPGEQAAGFGRVPAGDPPSPARTPRSPGPRSSGFPGELEGPRTPAYPCPGLWESQTLPGSCPTTKDGSPGLPGKPPPFLWPPLSLSRCFRKPLQASHPVPPIPCLNLSTYPAWVLDLTSGFEGSQGQGCASHPILGLLRTGPCVLQGQNPSWS